MSNAQEIQALIINDDLLDALDLVKLAISESEELNPLSIFCSKTGHEIGKRETNSLFECVKIHNKEHLISVLYNSHGLNVHPAWVQTDPASLDTLQLADPLGYAVYCLGLMTDQYYSAAFARKMSYQNAPAERHWAIARANARLRGMSENDLMELCASLCHLLTFAPETLNYTQRILGALANTPDTLATMARNKTLVPALNRAINSAMTAIGNFEIAWSRKKFEETPLTPSDMAKGPSQIRGQKRSRRKVISEEILFLEHKLSFLSLDGTLSPHAQRAKDNSPLHIDLADLADLDLDAMEDEFDDDEDDDNEVIIRRIPRSIITGAAIGTKSYQPPKPTSNSILARLAPKVIEPAQPLQVNLNPTPEVSATANTPLTPTTRGNSILSRLRGN